MTAIAREKGTAYLNVEDLSRRLGFVDYQEKVSATSGRKTYEVIRRSRVNEYLQEFGFSQRVGILPVVEREALKGA